MNQITTQQYQETTNANKAKVLKEDAGEVKEESDKLNDSAYSEEDRIEEAIDRMYEGMEQEESNNKTVVDESMDQAELIEILEGERPEDGSRIYIGEDNQLHLVNATSPHSFNTDQHYQIQIIDEEELVEEQTAEIDDDAVKMIALKQMMSLPVKKRGRKKKDEVNDDAATKTTAKASTKASVNNNLAKANANTNSMMLAPVKFAQVTKKQVFWDPDSNERQPVMIIEATQNVCKNRKSPNNQGKKKRTEIDRLLGDEGAINMLYSIENTETESKDMAAKVEIIKQATTTPRNRILREHISPSVVAKVKEEVKKTPNKKRKNLSDFDGGWDNLQVRQITCDDEMIVRRRSNSTDYSAGTSPRRLSLDFARPKETPPENDQQVAVLNKAKVLKMKDRLNQMITGRKTKRKHESGNAISTAQLNNIAILKYENYVHIELFSTKVGEPCFLSTEALQEIRNALQLLQMDNACKLVLISSVGLSFCSGLALKELTKGAPAERKVQKIANGYKEFLTSVASFTKPLVAAVHGRICGLGVTMLPLFDVVVAEQDSIFTTNYSTIGQIPEGNAILDDSSKINNGLISRLLYLEEDVTSEEALLGGLVTKVLPADDFINDAKEIAQKLATVSYQTITDRKEIWIENHLAKLKEALQREEHRIVKIWMTKSCLENIKSLLSE